MLSDKFVRKYMKIAKAVALDNTSCYSRQLGSVLVNPQTHAISVGYNGPPRGTPHCDSRKYLREVFLPLLTPAERQTAYENICHEIQQGYIVGEKYNEQKFLDLAEDCKICPRKLINAKSGQRLELCSCCHSETNTIVNAGFPTHGCDLFLYCNVPPCVECAKLIINAGIRAVYIIEGNLPDYSPQTRWLFTEVGVELYSVAESNL